MSEKELNGVFNEIFSIMAPGQPLRNAVDRIKEAQLGALIVLSTPEKIEELMEGGFTLDTDFSPQKLYELAKMDGAVLISEDISKIYGANLQLQPDHTIDTDESGTRHRTAHRIAKQTGCITITVSERRNKITTYKNDFKYSLDSIGDLLIKSSQATMSLEKYSSIINKFLNNLNYLEIENLVTLDDIIKVIRFFILLFNMDNKIDKYILELGDEGRILQLQRREIMMGHKTNFINLIKDYTNSTIEKLEKPEKLFDKITKIDAIGIAEDEAISKTLGYDLKKYIPEDTLTAKGYRLLSNVTSLTKKDTAIIIKTFEDVNGILNASLEDLENIKELNKTKAYKVIRVCERYKNIVELENL